MKKTTNINLAGYPFIIDEDAYNLLRDYLDTIRYAFETTEDTEDLAADIETRIAEILIEKENGGVRIVSAEEISSIISRIGKPSDFIEIEETVSSNNPHEKIHEEENVSVRLTPPPVEPSFSENLFTGKKKLFRDTQNAMLGGVCSGLAVYLNLDPTIVRLITVALLFLSASVVAIVYIILWIVVPAANTPLQRMQMRGEDPTVENIGRSVTQNYREEDPRNQSPANNRSGFWKFVYNCCSVFTKFLVILGLLIAIPIILALFIVFIACIISLFAPEVGIDNSMFMGGFFGQESQDKMLFHMLLAVLGGILTIGIPVWLVFRRKKRKPESSNSRRSLVLLWIAGIALTSVFVPKTVKDVKKLEKNKTTNLIEMIDELDIDLDENEENIRELSINKDAIKIVTKDGKTKVITRDGIVITDNTQPTAPETEEVEEESENVITTDSVASITVKKETVTKDTTKVVIP